MYIDKQLTPRFITDAYRIVNGVVLPLDAGILNSFSTLNQAREILALCKKIDNDATLKDVSFTEGFPAFYYNYQDASDPGNLKVWAVNMTVSFTQGQEIIQGEKEVIVGELIRNRILDLSKSTELMVDEIGQVRWK